MSGAPRGAAADYYDQSNKPQYSAPQGPPPNGQQFGQAPPQYGQKYSNGTEEGYTVANGEKPSFEQAFKLQGPKYHDIWAGILLILVFLGFVAVSAISVRGYALTKGFNGGGIYDSSNTFGLDTNTLVLFVFCLLVAFVLSYGYMWLARAFTKQFIWITGILNIIFGFATAAYMLSRRYWSGGIVFLLFSIFTVICFISWIPRIPFSVLMLQTSIDVSKKFGHVYLVSLIGGIVATAFGAWYSVTLVAVYVNFSPGSNPTCSTGVGSCSRATVIGLVVFITFAMYWISEWIKNTIHTTIAGVYGSWYFCSHNFPSNATRGAFRRATTYSFGSISLGSLLVAIINMLRQACSVAQRSEGMQGNMVGYIAFCILGCLISVLQWAVQFVNRYAFCHIALYGKPYIKAAKDTWKMLTQRGIDALINELLIGPVLTMGATFIAYACALLAYLYLLFTEPEYNRDGSFTPVVVAFAFLIGLQICNIFTTPLSSGVETIMVASAWDPEVLMRDHPDLYARMIAVYPKVQQAIHA
ncbi:pH nine-sensitive protein 1 [Coniosporium apollinis]|uniref:Protein PNS1 n=1 Tax=Coniosporium apollinis TaxID=61459 RepID=A0ABQ9P7M1_9PEZI|nr:pH nine-sensitive protein 1 [Coniosporium apollinis]